MQEKTRELLLFVYKITFRPPKKSVGNFKSCTLRTSIFTKQTSAFCVFPYIAFYYLDKLFGLTYSFNNVRTKKTISTYQVFTNEISSPLCHHVEIKKAVKLIKTPWR